MSDNIALRVPPFYNTGSSATTVILSPSFNADASVATAIVSLPESRLATGANNANDATKEHGWPHEVFDLLALASAFFSSVALAPLLAYSASDFAEADARSFANSPAAGPIAISSGVALWAPLATILSCLALVASVLARVLITVEAQMRGSRRARMTVLIRPFALLATAPLAIAVIIMPSSLYYCGFVMFPDAVTYTPRWFSLGASFAVISGMLVVYTVGILAYYRFVWPALPALLENRAQQNN